jgi:ComF family protein
MATIGPTANRIYKIYHFAWLFLDWIYPPYCGGCGQAGERWCKSCQNGIEKIGTDICSLCGELKTNNLECERCLSWPKYFVALRSYGLNKGALRNAIHKLKYQNDIALGEALSIHLIDFLSLLAWPIDIISPIPLSKTRYRERGYNQSALLGKPVALALNIKYEHHSLMRVRDTNPQVGLNRNERGLNVSGAFIADTKYITGKTVLLVDDVVTTGSTMVECAKALLLANAKCVYGLTLARAVYNDDNEQH